MIEQTELRGTSMGPNSPPNAIGTAKFAPEIVVLGNPALLVILAILGQNKPFLVLASHFRARADLQQKNYAGGA